MFRYLKAAFWAGPPVPILGKIPFNVLGVLAAFVLGFVEPAIWLVGGALEVAYLFILATNPRFQKVVEAQGLAQAADQTEAKKLQLIATLSPASRDRLTELQDKCLKSLELSRNLGEDDFSHDSNRDALRKLEWLYLKLLIARKYLQSEDSGNVEKQVASQIASIRAEISNEKTPPSIRDSKSATLELLEKRLNAVQRRKQTLAEVDSDLARIEAQVDLAVETAPLKGESHRADSIDLVAQLFDNDVFGTSSETVAELDRTFQKRTAQSGGPQAASQ